MIKAVIFDLDGTLCDTMDDLRTAMNAMLQKLGYKTRSRAELIKNINNGAKEFVRRSLPRDVQKVDFIVDSALEVYGAEYAKCYCKKTKPFDGIKAVLSELKRRGYKLAVLSNKQDEFVKTIVTEIFGKGFFNLAVGHKDMPTKPNPTSAIAIAKKLGVKTESCVMIGDSDVDVQTGINAQMQVIGVSWGYRERELLSEAGALNIADTPDDILRIIDEFNA